MCKKTFNKLKLSKILLGVLVFIVASVCVDAAAKTLTLKFNAGGGSLTSACNANGTSKYSIKNSVSCMTTSNSCLVKIPSGCKGKKEGYDFIGFASSYGTLFSANGEISGTSSGLYIVGGETLTAKYKKSSVTPSEDNNPTGPFCSNSNSSGKTQATKDAGKSIVSKSECNNLYSASRGDYYKSEWYGTCCYISVRNTGSSTGQKPSVTISEEQKCRNNGNYWNTNTSKASKGCYKYDKNNCNTFGLCGKDSKCDSYCTNKVSFDSNYGKTLLCEKGYVSSTSSDLGSQICTKDNVSSGEKVNFPSSSSNMYREGQGQFIGWTKTVSNGTLNCNSSVIVKDSSFTVSASNYYYACYREDIGGYRYLQNDYVADGGSVDFNCGDKIWVEYCTKESGNDYCYYYENSTGKYRKIHRMKLTNTYEAASGTCGNSGDNTTQEDYGYRYVALDGQNYSCGDQLYITTCTEDACNYT